MQIIYAIVAILAVGLVGASFLVDAAIKPFLWAGAFMLILVAVVLNRANNNR